MLFLFFRGRYGPLIRAVIGVALVVFGIVDSAKFALILGGVLLVWAVAAGVRLLGRDRLGPGR